jgi:amino acid adenylation domain-containing protein/thioester reductase-like protein
MSDFSNIIPIHTLVERQVAQTPDAVAVVFQDQILTYQELNERANQLAYYLKELGVAPDILVGVCIDRSIELIITLLAILKANGAYLPLDISYPEERLEFMLGHAKASILLTQTHLIKRLPKNDVRVICLDVEQQRISQYSQINPPIEVTPEHLAYVIYTSGSTGQPKGVAMPHRALCNLLNWQNLSLPISIGSRILQFAPISFDVSFQEIFSTISSGGTLVLIEESERCNPVDLLKRLRVEKIERIFLPFVALRHLAEWAVKEDKQLPELKDVITAGEQLRITPQIVKWFEGMPNCRLHNHYGPSESHVVTSLTLSGVPQDWPILPPIGQPIANTQIYILDPQLNSLPQGVSGELYISGLSLAKGYLNAPEITSQKFILNPFNQNLQEHFYKTGDLARYLPDGNIEYTGRIDQQVKIRGYRVEPAEIEATLEKHLQVHQALVIMREGLPNDRRKNVFEDMRLVAYILPTNKNKITDIFEASITRELRQFLKTQLPEYMIPSAFVILEELPITPSGKVDRRALPLPKWTRIEEGIYIAPSNEIELQLAQIWKDLLSIEQVSIHDDFFEIGGHSLLALQLVSQVRELFQIDVCLESFLENPTLIGIVKVIETYQNKEKKYQEKQDLELEERLDDSIYPENHLTGPIPSIFLTGATGILGTALLHKLLTQTRSDIYCLVRASRIEEGQAKIHNGLKRYGFYDQRFNHRIFPILGDLSQSCLGLRSHEFHRLTEKIDVIYHSGAWVNIAYPYSVLKASNVLGTQEILRLASIIKTKPVHYVSTVDVYSSLENESIISLESEASIGPLNHLYSGYAQSKYVAEQLVRKASERGIPVTIYQPSNIFSFDINGIIDPSSFVGLMIKGCIQMGIAPNFLAILNLVSVEYASQKIFDFSKTEKMTGKVFKVLNSDSIKWEDLINKINGFGYSVKMESYENWYSSLVKISHSDSRNVLSPLVNIFANKHFIQKLLGIFEFINDRTNNKKNDDFTRQLFMADEFLKKYFNYLKKIDLFPPHSQNNDFRFDNMTNQLENKKLSKISAL